MTEKKMTDFENGNWVSLKDKEPPFGYRVITWNANTPDEPPMSMTLLEIRLTQKGKIYEWYEKGFATHWQELPHPPVLTGMN